MKTPENPGVSQSSITSTRRPFTLQIAPLGQVFRWQEKALPFASAACGAGRATAISTLDSRCRILTVFARIDVSIPLHCRVLVTFAPLQSAIKLVLSQKENQRRG
ncbi:hypothetical protein [Mesorhizobium sp. ES1-3]|uniref:hypothetical protein n=1 Tax=Mesorhizobium sp. ES1-3 TaxID=2876628 RepID=UPI001CCE75D7|nr:hypothetical protein [Mesorhizobium sp. ES1-3]MBZ9669929.1 hypothetical protein [Mesorhizobium sp. ES1-3]